MADQNNITSVANLSSPAEPEEKIRGQFSVYYWNDRFFFLVSYSKKSDHSHSAYSHSRRDQETTPLGPPYFSSYVHSTLSDKAILNYVNQINCHLNSG